MRRVVVTGLGMVTPLADGVEATWKRLLAGESGAGKIKHFDASHLACGIACDISREEILSSGLVSKEEYEDLVSKMPKSIRWEDLSFYELEDGTSTRRYYKLHHHDYEH